MTLEKEFKSFCKAITLDNYDNMKKTAGEIAKKLNSYYYGIEGDMSSHMYIVGSVGRKTAIRGSSDLDILFDLPEEIYDKYNGYKSYGQSALLQDVKSVLAERYPKTNISGDGQVVVIAFNKYTVELVPAFQNNDGSFTYPDTHDGGSWKTTNPIPEQEECKSCNYSSDGIYYDVCHMIRSWKNSIGLSMGGLLIDTLVYDVFLEKEYFKEYEYRDYFSILMCVFEYFKNQDKKRSYWFAVGSNQKVYNSNNGEFVTKAKETYEKINEAIESGNEIEGVLAELLGNDFSSTDNFVVKNAEFNSCDKYAHFRGAKSEQFIGELFSVDIRYSLQIDCMVTQKGFQSCFLSVILREHKWIGHDLNLDFQIIKTDCPKPYFIYWKVRNVGIEAEKRNMIRGEICCTNKSHQKEHTDFYGPHYVECYLVKNNVCVAKARINVPIK